MSCPSNETVHQPRPSAYQAQFTGTLNLTCMYEGTRHATESIRPCQ
jgi:hypothetical protein